MSRQVHITYVINHAAFFVSHRLPLAIGARKAGYQVDLLTGQAGSASMEPHAEAVLSKANIAHKRVAFRSASVNPLLELRGLLELVFSMRRSRPDLVHCASPKGLLYGGLAARVNGVKAVVLAISGVGFAQTDAGKGGWKRRIIGMVYRQLARFAYGHKNLEVIVQNLDDKAALLSQGLVKEAQITLIPGSGVELSAFIDAPIERKTPIVMLPARMLKDKGVIEFVNAARAIKAAAPDWRFVLAGAADYGNPTSVSREQIAEWEAEGLVEFLGHVENIAPWFREASIVCLPSYREGMPKALLEAAAAGCAVVTTDAIGCREAIVNGETGDLVPIRDTEALTAALLSLINDRARRERYGEAGRRLSISKFGIEAVTNTTLAIYARLLKHA
ncbi:MULTISPECIES: glycosyltransferase family 4 protein [Pandoraea]|uniref:Glycosyl transferase n=1 Tax=Pandoraea capi TaxID=2508286 RepID=A0ABY6W8G5_9BURK|nr:MULTISPECIES: glycosyltransferase family 4 protein [Pandoraea]MCI3204938.1 glycosyltransferase family 1 protein [Pandoraea sp. LA3]MDN4582966.1 glycosyltransferase family 1 protein [Pandoraea capi]VVE39533.1 glycosyl transferase [Pandoraea capi]